MEVTGSGSALAGAPDGETESLFDDRRLALVRDADKWLADKRRDPAPERVTNLIARLAEFLRVA